jgi:DNA polymerase
MAEVTPSAPHRRARDARSDIAPSELPQRLRPVAKHRKAPATMADLERAMRACRACPLWRDATQAVPGEGRARRPVLMLVGEQPGDREDLAGKPFVGPAGLMLDRALEKAGVAREETFVTNAVKHFKHELRGKRRLHKRPGRSEVEICRWWLEHEIELVRPKLVVAMGVTALQALSAHKGSLKAVRGKTIATREGAPLRATVHPSLLLRVEEDADKRAEFARFVADLKAAKEVALAA